MLKFTLDTHPGSSMHYLGLLKFPVRCLTHHNHTRDVSNYIYPMSMIAISSLDFLLLSCLHLPFTRNKFKHKYGGPQLSSKSYLVWSLFIFVHNFAVCQRISGFDRDQEKLAVSTIFIRNLEIWNHWQYFVSWRSVVCCPALIEVLWLFTGGYQSVTPLSLSDFLLSISVFLALFLV